MAKKPNQYRYSVQNKTTGDIFFDAMTLGLEEAFNGVRATMTGIQQADEPEFKIVINISAPNAAPTRGVKDIETAYKELPQEIEQLMVQHGIGAKDLYFILKKFANSNPKLSKSNYWKAFREHKL